MATRTLLAVGEAVRSVVVRRTSGGNVLLRLRTKKESANKTVLGGTDCGLVFTAKNLGPG